MRFIHYTALHSKKLYLTIIMTFICCFKMSAQNDTLYFNHKWKKTTKDSAVYYRIKPLKIKTKDAVGYKIKNTDSLFVIKDYYLNTDKLQFQGYSKDYEAELLVGKANWFDENGEKSEVDFSSRQNNNAPRFRVPELPIFYFDYKITSKSLYTVGLEFCMDCENDNKLFLGLGFGLTTYNGTSYGLPNLHLSYNTEKLLFIKGGASNKHAYALAGITLLNIMDIGFGYSLPFDQNKPPVIKGFTFGATLRLAGNSKNAYPKFNIIQ